MPLVLNAIPTKGLPIYKRLLTAVRPYKGAFVLAIIGNVAYGSIDALTVKMIKPLLDEGFVARDADFIRWLPFMVLSLFLVRSLATFLSSYFMGWVARKIVMDFRQKIFARMLHLPHSFYDKHPSGPLVSCITYNVEQVANASTDAVTILLRETFLATGLLIVMFWESWQLTLLFLTTVPLMMLIMRQITRRTRAVSSHIQESIAQVTQITEESIEGQTLIKSSAMQDQESQRFNHMSEENRRQEMRFIRITAVTIPLLQICVALTMALTLYLATAQTALTSHVTPGGFSAIVGAMLVLLKPIKQLAKVNSIIQRGISAAASIFWIIDQPIEANEPVRVPDRLRGDVRFENVSFAYETEEGPRKVLSHINLHLTPGSSVALVGPSGGGKTTLVHLLSRFYEPTDGQISVDGCPLQDYELQALRQNIALVSQNITLFNETIAYNIGYGVPGATREAIEQAAETAHLKEFTNALPQGLDTLIGDNGTRLSGGQRQRIAIARAFLKNAPILILDEATSALDSESERCIQAAFETLMKDRTTLVVAHRLSTIERCDRIVVVDQGRVVEEGDHETLLRQQQHYAHLWMAQRDRGYREAEHAVTS